MFSLKTSVWFDRKLCARCQATAMSVSLSSLPLSIAVMTRWVTLWKCQTRCSPSLQDFMQAKTAKHLLALHLHRLSLALGKNWICVFPKNVLRLIFMLGDFFIWLISGVAVKNISHHSRQNKKTLIFSSWCHHVQHSERFNLPKQQYSSDILLLYRHNSCKILCNPTLEKCVSHPNKEWSRLQRSTGIGFHGWDKEECIWLWGSLWGLSTSC